MSWINDFIGHARRYEGKFEWIILEGETSARSEPQGEGGNIHFLSRCQNHWPVRGTAGHGHAILEQWYRYRNNAFCFDKKKLNLHAVSTGYYLSYDGIDNAVGHIPANLNTMANAVMKRGKRRGLVSLLVLAMVESEYIEFHPV